MYAILAISLINNGQEIRRMRTPPRDNCFCQLTAGKQRKHSLLSAVLCSTAPPALQDFCGEGDVDR
jgi:hypothetical protein